MKFGFAGILLGAILVTGCANEAVNVQDVAVSLEETKKETLLASEEQVIEAYLTDKLLSPATGDVRFAAYERLEEDTQAGEMYAWSLVEAYDLTRDASESTRGVSIPVVLKVSRTNGSLAITGHTTPRDGSYYAPDVRALFPARIQNKILRYSSQHIQTLIKELEQKVKAAKENGTPRPQS
ncbi:hypothetical protein [Paenibacillus methanolicus]|uniref:Lipoprotein n=1 Tax=Paenibacillus methanolicus TaxID=582686 RepID=A0A5S5C2I3_9BACL|nr:hypothetical protein [Paenibacillus methanolicus]TYP73369.1 hypothetical protein BCM02_107353 [Paenibacillus methanolicus]